MVESWIVIPAVVGSNPISHPIYLPVITSKSCDDLLAGEVLGRNSHNGLLQTLHLQIILLTIEPLRIRAVKYLDRVSELVGAKR